MRRFLPVGIHVRASSIVLILTVLYLSVSVSWAAPKKAKRRTLRTLKMNTRQRTKTFVRVRSRVKQAPKMRKAPKAPVPGTWRSSRRTSANEVNERAQDALRRQRIRLLRSLLSSLSAVVPGEKEQKVKLLHRLAEEYRARARFLAFMSMARYDRAMARWFRAKGKKKGPRPAPKLEMSRAHDQQALSIFKKMLAILPSYERADEVLLTMALVALRLKQPAKAKRHLLALFKSHGKSRYAPDGRLLLAGLLFKARKLASAMEQYRKAMSLAGKWARRPKLDKSKRMAMNGVTIRSMYMLAWCHMNAGSFDRAIRRFKQVVTLSIRYKRRKSSRILLRDEGLRDLLLAYARKRSFQVLVVHNYLARQLGKKVSFRAMMRLARRLHVQTNYQQAIVVYRHLQSTSPTGQNAREHRYVPDLALGIVRSGKVIWTLERTLREVGVLARLVREDAVWRKRWGRSAVGRAALEKIASALLGFSTQAHQQAQTLERKKPARSEALYAAAIRVYETFLLSFPKHEQANEINFFLAELLYRRASRLAKRGGKRVSNTMYSRAARHYRRVASNRKRTNAYRKQALFSVILCYESMLSMGRQVRIRPGKWAIRGRVKMAGTRAKQSFPKGSIQALLVQAYASYLPLVKQGDERLETYFKMGVLYYNHRYYLRAMSTFASMVKAFPHHELSRKAAFMVLYGYKDLQEWASLEDTARHYLKHRILMKKKAFRREVFAMLIRAAYQPLWNEAKRHLAKQGEIPRLLVRRLLRYEREFGVEGSWLSKGFPASARASYALAIAGRCLTRNKRMFGAIDARKRLIRLYPSFPKRANVMRELGVHYRQIAYYKLAADWFERYLRETLGAKGSYEQQAAQARKWSKTKRKRWEMALFQAATLRKGLGNWRRAVALWKSLLILFPKHKTASNIRIEVARIYERARQYSSAILAYQKAIQEDRSDGLKAFFKKLARRKPKPLAMIGMTSFAGLPFRNGKPVFRGPKPGLLRHVGRLTKAATVHGARELFLLSRLAHCYGKRKQKDDLQRVHMQMNALGFQMVLQQHAAMKRGSVSRGLFARARFALVEQTRALYHSLAFTGSTSRNRVVLRTLMKEGKRLHQQYAEVVGLGIAQWALASVFRQGQLLQAFAEKLSRSPVPAGYRGRLARRYRELLRMRMVRMEDRALAMYEQVLRLSARFGVYNRWVRACEQARNALTGKRNKVNPFTIFQRRKSSFWLVETPFVTKLFSTRPVPRTKPTVRR